MPLSINDQKDLKKQVWTFYIKWLETLKINIQQALEMLDEAIIQVGIDDNDQRVYRNIEAEDIVHLFKNFSGRPEETYTTQDLSFKEDLIHDHFEESTVKWFNQNKNIIIARLYVPLPEHPKLKHNSMTLALNFYLHFSPEKSQYNVKLDINDNILVL